MVEKQLSRADFLDLIRSRRVARAFSDEPVSEEMLWQILEMARWAPAASNRRMQRYICITDRTLIDQIRLVSPGMGGLPTALIVICVDWGIAGFEAYDRSYRNTYIDVGTAAENMLLAAHALGLGAWPMTSFSVPAVVELLNISPPLRPEMFIGLGHPATAPAKTAGRGRPKTTLRIEDLVQWGVQ